MGSRSRTSPGSGSSPAPDAALARRLRYVAGVALGFVVGLWVRTLRVVVEGEVGGGGRARVFAFFHGQQLALLAIARRLRLAVLVSHSLDGELQTGVMRQLGFRVVRGSTSRGGAAGLRGVVSELRAGLDAAFAVDGPRGPREVAKGGAVLAARAAGAALVPVAAAVPTCVVLERSWDRFRIPLPFSRVVLVVGEPLEPRTTTPAMLSDVLLHAERRARVLAGRDTVHRLAPPEGARRASTGPAGAEPP